ncbi:MAG: hypothetical protein V1901_04325 [Patescibacteria group bacterium]
MKYEFFDLNKLYCYGCAHSSSIEAFPGKPSGERPCCFCIRNKNRKLEVKTWYNDSEALKIPMDCYHSLDMLEQIYLWNKKKEKHEFKI